MEELNTRKLIEIKESRTGDPVPVVKGIYLHSIYSPVKEAEAFARDYEQSVQRKSSALILGIGFGYHIQEVLSLGKRFHKDFKVMVLEPNRGLIEEFKKTEIFQKLSPFIKIVHSERPEQIFEKEEFIMFLTQKPAIIKHDPSYNLSRDYFQGFLTFKASNRISDYRPLLSKKSSDMLSSWEGSMEQGLQSVMKSGRVTNKNDYVLFLMNAIVESTQKASSKA